jgi:hypothetical protein
MNWKSLLKRFFSFGEDSKELALLAGALYCLLSGRGKLFPAQPVLFIGCTAHLGQSGGGGDNLRKCFMSRINMNVQVYVVVCRLYTSLLTEMSTRAACRRVRLKLYRRL